MNVLLLIWGWVVRCIGVFVGRSCFFLCWGLFLWWLRYFWVGWFLLFGWYDLLYWWSRLISLLWIVVWDWCWGCYCLGGLVGCWVGYCCCVWGCFGCCGCVYVWYRGYGWFVIWIVVFGLIVGGIGLDVGYVEYGLYEGFGCFLW